MSMEAIHNNLLADFEEIISALSKDYLLPSDLVSLVEMGIEVAKVADVLVNRYVGTNQYIRNLRHQFGPLTQSQVRTVLNDFLATEGERLGVKKPEPAAEPVATNPSRKVGLALNCYSCNDRFPSWDALYEHKRIAHGGKERAPIVTEDPKTGATSEGKAVIENTAAGMGLDLTNLPDGRYAVPNMSGENKDSNVFIMVKRVRRTHNRDRRYRYGKIVTGSELVLAGTIEVKLWSSDAKELVGEQKPDDVYRGKLEKELELLMHSPESFGKLFGRLMHKCCICGKSLTDDISRDIGMGLECEKKVNYFSSKPPTLRPECPTCPGQVARYGTLVTFSQSSGTARYRCGSQHEWLVSKKGDVIVPID